MNPITVVILGAGNRGSRYAEIMAAFPENYKIVAVADPAKAHRDYVQKLHNIPDEQLYTDWRQILDQPKMADVCVVATVDNMHYEPALKAIELGYDLLLEKPVAMRAEDCAAIANAAKEKGVKVLVCHVLRYTNFFGTLKEIRVLAPLTRR